LQGPIAGRFWASLDGKVGANGSVVAFTSVVRNFDASVPSAALRSVYVRAGGAPVPIVSPVDGSGFPNGSSRALAVSPDAGTRYVLYSSVASNVVASDTNGKQDVLLFDRVSSTTERVSVGSGPASGASVVQANGDTTRAAMSGNVVDGNPRYVVFVSNASNLDPIDEQGFANVFLRDRQNRTTTLISKGVGGVAANGDAFAAVVSDDGNTVAFSSAATNLVAGDGNSAIDVFVWKRTTGVAGQVSRVSVGMAGEGSGASTSPQISADGRFVAFDSGADDLVSGDDNISYDVFVRDLLYGTTERVSVGPNGEQGSWDSQTPSMSRDGRYIAFESDVDTEWNTDDGNISVDVYVRDRLGQNTIRASEKSSVTANGFEVFGDSTTASISPEGRFVAFETDSGDFFEDTDVNDDYDVYVKDLSTQFWNTATIGSRFQGVTPTRVLDTVSSANKLVSGTARDVTVTGGATNVPTSATAVVLNLVASNETTAGADLVVYPTGARRPKVSALNPQIGAPVSNQAVVKVGSGGKVSFFTSKGSTDLVVDVAGYYAPDVGYGYTSVRDSKLLDTRTAKVPATWSAGQPLQAGTPRATLTLPVAGVGTVPEDARAVALQVSTLSSTVPGAKVSVYPAGSANSGAASSLPQVGQIITSLVVVPVGQAGAVAVTVDVGSTHVLADVVGYYGPSADDLFFPLVPERAFDTASTTTTTSVPGVSGQLPIAGRATLPVAGRAGVPTNARAASLVISTSGVTAPALVLTWPADDPSLPVLTVSARPGIVVGNSSTGALGTNGALGAVNYGASPVTLTGDVYGYFR
jgi:hypothetical protein